MVKRFFLVILGASVSVFIPDIDLAFSSLIGHRSILTHSLLPPLCALLLRRKTLAGAMAVGFAIHLNADLFPAAWVGFATIKLPLSGHLGAWPFPWLLLNSFILLTIAHVIFHNSHDRSLTYAYYASLLTVGTIYILRDRVNWVPLVMFLLTWSAAVVSSRKLMTLKPRLLRHRAQVAQAVSYEL